MGAWHAIVEFHDDGQRRFRSLEGPFVRRTEDPDGLKARALELVAPA